MGHQKSKAYWITLPFVVVIGAFFIFTLPQNGLLYAYGLLLLFWLGFYIFERKNR